MFCIIILRFLKSISHTAGLFKWIINPKIKMFSSFTHPQVVPNLYEFLSLTEHKRRYFEIWVTKQLISTNDFHSMEVNGVGLVTDILQNIIFCIQQKKETHTGLEQLEDE